MLDQANHLRRLARRCASQEASVVGRRPHLIVVASGKGGVGTTTIAVNLAVAMAGHRLRTVLVDADLQGGDAAILCGLDPKYSLADVLDDRRTIHEVLQPGPRAIRVAPGDWRVQRPSDCRAAAGKCLMGELEGLAGDADLLLLDGGTSPDRATQPTWQAADLILVLTTPETSSVINSFALIKMLAEGNPAVQIHLLVNLASRAEVAHDVQRRLAEACRRFLGIHLTSAGHLGVDSQVAEAGARGEPFVIASPGCGATRHLQRLAAALAASLAGRNTAREHFNAPDTEPCGKPQAAVVSSLTQETPKSRKNGKNDSTTRRPQPIGSEHCR